MEKKIYLHTWVDQHLTINPNDVKMLNTVHLMTTHTKHLNGVVSLITK